MGATRLSTKVDQWFEEEFAKQSQDDDITWEVAIGPGTQGPVLAIFAVGKGSILGTLAQSVFILTNPFGVEQSDVEELVRRSLDQVAQERSRQLAVSEEALKGNGFKAPPG